jgi:hypothetical protein
MHLKSVRPRRRPIDTLVGAMLLGGAALAILPGVAAFAMCVTIAGAARLLVRQPKKQAVRALRR